MTYPMFSPKRLVVSLLCLLFPVFIYAQQCYMVSGAVNVGADTDINGFYQQSGIESGCDKFDLVGNLLGSPATAGDYRLAKKDNLFWATIRNSDNIMRYFKLSFDCNMFESGYAPCCSQGGSLLVVKVSDNGCSAFVLPVEISAFSARLVSNAILLNWATASETNNEGFFVERSFDANNWELAGFVPGHGTSLEVRQYSFADGAVFSGTTYYRLKQVDFDGRFEYSKVVSVNKNKDAGSLSIYPNPAADYLYFTKGVDGEILFYNLPGQLLLRQTFESPQDGVDISSLGNGQYILLANGNDGKVRSARFVVER
ncbi:MAG: T9SS type A sorting domain-containing protein [Saprospiraceae bacterium]|nr:MAG: T9SS type A sorting domain-containing protein [Saprospiraceae bacterium]